MTQTDSHSPNARALAQQALADELAQTQKKQTALTQCFKLLTSRSDIDTKLGVHLRELKSLGFTPTRLASALDLSTTETRRLLALDTPINPGAASSEKDTSSDDADKESTPATPSHDH